MKCLVSYHHSSPEGEIHEVYGSTEEFIVAYPIFKSLLENHEKDITVVIDLPDDPASIKVKVRTVP